MHPLHDHVAKQLAGKLEDRPVVVWYDERGELRLTRLFLIRRIFFGDAKTAATKVLGG